MAINFNILFLAIHGWIPCDSNDFMSSKLVESKAPPDASRKAFEDLASSGSSGPEAEAQVLLVDSSKKSQTTIANSPKQQKKFD